MAWQYGLSPVCLDVSAASVKNRGTVLFPTHTTMILNTDEVMADALLRMDDTYAKLRAIVADESALNVSCSEMLVRRVALNDAINSVFATRNAFREIKCSSRATPSTQAQ